MSSSSSSRSPLAVLLLLVAGCGAEEPASPAPAESPASAASTPARDPAARASAAAALDPAARAAAARAAATRAQSAQSAPARPADMPDSKEDPLAYLYWRIDRIFLNTDKNKDGLLDNTEYRGPSGDGPERHYAYIRIDADGDGSISKEEMIADAITQNPALYGGK